MNNVPVDTRLWLLRTITASCFISPLLGFVSYRAGYPLVEPWILMFLLVPLPLAGWVWHWQRWGGAAIVDLLTIFTVVNAGILILWVSESRGLHMALSAYHLLPFVGVVYRSWRLSLLGGVLGLLSIWAWLLWGPDLLLGEAAVQNQINHTALLSAITAAQAIGAYVLWTAEQALLMARSTAEMLRQEAEHERDRAAENERLYRLLADNAGDLIALHEPDGTLAYVSPSSQALLGYAPEELVGTQLYSRSHPDERAAVFNAQDAARSGRPGRILHRVQKKSGGHVWLESVIQPIDAAGGGPVQLQSTSRDVTERKAFEEQLQHRAFHDPLTGLPNRALFEERVRHAIAQLGRFKQGVAVLFLDLDDFKGVNDSLGHHAGDQVLGALGQRLSGCLRSSDTLARLGGDEFGIVLEGRLSQEDVEKTVQRLLAVLETPFSVEGQEFLIRASIGVASAEHEGEVLSSSVVQRNADTAMYEAKSRGTGQYVLFDQRMMNERMDRLELETQLRRAVERNELRLHYQPIVSLKTGERVGFEALVRWQHPERGLLLPGVFIPLAEQSDLIQQIGWWVLAEAARQARLWQAQHPKDPPLIVSVNLSARQFRDPNLVEGVQRVLRETDLDPLGLHFEITESALMQDLDAVVDQIQRLKALGIRFAIDDFGTGFASMGYLSRLPVDYLKIDRSFVNRLDEGEKEIAVVQSVLGLAKQLNLIVVGEGIETAEQLDYLSTHSCQQGQGFFLARPMDAEAATEFLIKQT